MITYIPQIKEHYEQITPKLINIKHNHWVTPYTDLVDFVSLFSPIEQQTWQAIRSFGKMPMYPQYPVNRFFVDFGNPKVKVAIECDGKEWHMDKQKDAERDNILLSEGWHIFRISGHECFKICEEYYDTPYQEDTEKIYTLTDYYKTIEGLIKAIAIFYFDYKDYYLYEFEEDLLLRCLMNHISPIQREFVGIKLMEKSCILSSEYYNWKDKQQ